MNANDWNRVARELEARYLPAREPYKTHAMLMLALLPKLQSQPWAYDITPVLSHGVLQLNLPDVQDAWIALWGEHEGVCRIHIYRWQSNTVEGEILTSREDVLTVVERLLQQLRARIPA
jgi:hypothetical protein